jgi:beta-glucosidase
MFTDWWFHTYAASFFKKVDYWGLSYYAYILFDPFPITVPDNPEKFEEMGIPHDKMWGYKPEGLARNLRRFHKRFNKPMVITENGICTDDSEVRIASIKDYLKVCHEAIADGIDLQGYVHWCTWDNFEWALGPTYRFGLVTVNLETMERTMTDAGRFYSEVAKKNEVIL